MGTQPRLKLVVASLALVVCLAGCGESDDQKAARAVVRQFYEALKDKDAALDNVRFESMGPGWHVTTGPAVILWRPGDQAQGDFETSATLIQTKAPAHPEAYGIFVGGQALQGPEQSYTYFLVRGDGKFLIKRRTGTTTTNVTEGWTENAAVVKANEAGSQQNTLSIQRAGDETASVWRAGYFNDEARDFHGTFDRHVDALLQALRRGDPPPVPASAGRRALELAMAAIRSHADGRRIAVSAV